MKWEACVVLGRDLSSAHSSTRSSLVDVWIQTPEFIATTIVRTTYTCCIDLGDLSTLVQNDFHGVDRSTEVSKVERPTQPCSSTAWAATAAGGIRGISSSRGSSSSSRGRGSSRGSSSRGSSSIMSSREQESAADINSNSIAITTQVLDRWYQSKPID